MTTQLKFKNVNDLTEGTEDFNYIVNIRTEIGGFFQAHCICYVLQHFLKENREPN